MTDRASPEEVAFRCLLGAMDRLEYYSSCQFCDSGHLSDDDGGDLPHDEECPFFGFDQTSDWKELKQAARDDLLRRGYNV